MLACSGRVICNVISDTIDSDDARNGVDSLPRGPGPCPGSDRQGSGERQTPDLQRQRILAIYRRSPSRNFEMGFTCSNGYVVQTRLSVSLGVDRRQAIPHMVTKDDVFERCLIPKGEYR